MMNLKKSYTIGLLAIASLFACEKDDICEGEAATPNMRIEFYDKANSTVLKPFYKLHCYAVPQTPTDSVKIIEFTYKSEIQLPLDITSNQTIWNVTLFEIVNNDTIQKTDQLTFTYNPKIEYVSKACGYKTVFENVTANLNANNPENWITNFTLLNNNIINQETPDAKIYY